MKLKAILDSLDGLTDDQKSFYVAKDGKFHLDVEGADNLPDVTALKNAYERTKADMSGLKSQIATLQEAQKAFEGLDAGKIKEMLKNVENSEDAKLISEGKIDEVVAKRTERVVADLKNQVEKLTKDLDKVTKERDTAAAKVASFIVDGAIRKAAKAAGLRPEAEEDAVLLGRTVFVVENDEPTARDSAGNLIPGDNNGKLTPESWMKNLKDKRPHWWPASTADGAPGNQGQGGDIKVNPWKKDNFNLTQQGQLVKSNPTVAKQFMRDAGIPQTEIDKVFAT